MSESRSVMDRLDSVLARFSERERMLLGVMAVTLFTLGVLASALVLRGRMETLNSEIDAKRSALSLLATQSEEYVRNSERNARLREQLRDNSIRLSTYIEGRAGRASIPRPREFRDNQLELDGGIKMLTTTVTFSSVELDQLQRLMESIEDSEELVFTRQIAVAPSRREAGLELELTLATFKQESRQ